MIKRLMLAFALVSFPAMADNFGSSLSNAVGGAGTGTIRLKSDDSVALDYPDLLDVTSAGVIKGDDSTDNCTALQAIIDANPTAKIYFPPGTYRSSCQIVLTNSSGKAFDGGLYCNNATLKFTTAGNTTDTDAAMQNGIVAYPKTNGLNGDTSGWGGSPRNVISGCTVQGPTNGASIHLANGIRQRIDRVHVKDNRYGIVFESSINAHVVDSSAFNWKNAALAFIKTDNANVYYGTNPSSTFWNDSYRVDGLEMADGNTDGTFACILDYGSNAERIRWLNGVSCQGKNGKTGVQYGYVGRLVFPVFTGTNWFESINYGLRIFSTNTNEGGSGTTIPGVTAAQPNGTVTVGSMPDGYCSGGVFEGLFNNGSTIAWQPDCNGIVRWGPSETNGVTTDIKLTQGGKTFLYSGNVRSDSAPSVIQNSYGGFVNMVGANVSIASGGGTSPSLNGGANSKGFRFTVGSGGSASSFVLNFDFTADNGWHCQCNNLTTVSTGVYACKQTATSTTSATFKNYSNVAVETAFGAGNVLNMSCEPY